MGDGETVSAGRVAGAVWAAGHQCIETAVAFFPQVRAPPADGPFRNAMSPIASIAVSGLNAASSRLETAAHNIANAQTPGFRRQLVQQTAQAEGGVTVSIGRAAATGDALIEDVVAQMSAAHAFEANVMTFKAQDLLLGSLLDATA
jgi:hypothetical protein